MYSIIKKDIRYSEPQYPLYAYWDGCFDESQLNLMEEEFDRLTMSRATVGGLGDGGNISLKHRNSNVFFKYEDNTNAWVFNGLKYVVNELNDRLYKMALVELEPLQLTQYECDQKQFYDFHTDSAHDIEFNLTRKLSCVMFLSSPETYKGGTFQFQIGPEPIDIEQPRGRIIVFPSYTLHRVMPVTEGTRRSLVTWVSGPPFV